MSNDHVHPTILAAMRPMIPTTSELTEVFKVRNAQAEIQLEADKATRQEADLQTTLEASNANLRY